MTTISYLIQHPDGVTLWKQGWPHNSRPSLRDRVAALGDLSVGAVGPQVPPWMDDPRAFVDSLNSLVHGDPQAALNGAVLRDDGEPAFTVSKDVASPARANDVSIFTTAMAVVLIGRTRELFPGAA